MNRTGKWSWASPDAQATFRNGGALELDFSSRVGAAVAADEEHARMPECTFLASSASKSNFECNILELTKDKSFRVWIAIIY